MAGNTFGRSVVGNFGTSLKLSSDGNPERKSAGLTIDWTKVAAAPADVTLLDSVTVLAGEKYLRYGQVVCLISTGEINTVTLSNGTTSPMTGNFTLTVNGNTSAAIAFNASNTTVNSTLQNMTTVGSGNVTSVSGAAGGPFTITFPPSMGNVTITGSNASLTNGTVTIATTSQGGQGSGFYGPYDPDAVDGRATLGDGTTFLINETIKESDAKSNFPDVIYGGEVFKDRLIATTGTHSLANGPTFTELRTIFPRLVYKI